MAFVVHNTSPKNKLKLALGVFKQVRKNLHGQPYDICFVLAL